MSKLPYFDKKPNISSPQIGAPPVTLEELLTEGSNNSNEQLRPKRPSQRLTPETIAKIVAAHTTYEGNATKAARAVGVSLASVQKYWPNAGLRVNTAAESLGLRQEHIAEILDAHFTYHGNAAEAARHLPYSSDTIRSYWRKNGFRVMLKGESIMLSKEERGRIIAMHAEVNGSASAASRALHHSGSVILNYWREAGLPVRKSSAHKKLTGEQIKEIVAAYETCGGIVYHAARLLSYRWATIMKYWEAHGLEPNNYGLNRKLTQN